MTRLPVLVAIGWLAAWPAAAQQAEPPKAGEAAKPVEPAKAAAGIDIGAQARKAQEQAAAGQFTDALDTLDEAAIAVWEKMPLSVRKAVLVVEEPQGYGVYNPRENAVFDGKTPLLIYAELAGHGWKRSGNLWRTDIQLGFELRSKAGEMIVAQEAFNTIATASRMRNREFFLHVTYGFTGLDAGDYSVRTIVKDRVGNKQAQFDQDFSVKK